MSENIKISIHFLTFVNSEFAVQQSYSKIAYISIDLFTLFFFGISKPKWEH